MKKLTTYLNLCTEVYDLSKPNPPQDAFKFYRQYAEEVHGPILEPMCGTGRYLIPLIEAGFDVHGFDASEQMLAALNSKAKNLSVWQGFIEELNVDEKYNLIFIPSGSFGLIIDPDAVKSALKKLRDHLSENGVLVFEVETVTSLPKLNVWRESVWHKTNGQKIVLRQFATLEGDLCSSICNYELVENDEVLHTENEILKVRIYDRNTILNILQSVGFEKIRLVKAFDRDDVAKDGDEIIVCECRFGI